MKHHRTRIVAAIGFAAVAALVATLIVVPALATPASGVTTSIIAVGHFADINATTIRVSALINSETPLASPANAHQMSLLS